MKFKHFFIYSLILMIISSCARTLGDMTPCISGHIYGFWAGLWHGIIAPFGLLGSLFDPQIKMYAPNNNGGWYALGFLFGSGGWGVLADKGVSKSK